MRLIRVSKEFLASGYYGVAHGRMISGRHEDALKKIKKAISIGPADYMSSLFLAKLGEIYMRMESYEDAIPVLEEAMDQLTKEISNPPKEVDMNIVFGTGQYLQYCRDRIKDSEVSSCST